MSKQTSKPFRQSKHSMRTLILLIILAAFQGTAVGQKTNSDSAVTNLTKLDIGPQGLGFSYEPKISSKLTTDLCIGVGGGYFIDKNSFDYNLFQPAVYFSVTPKYFYNIHKRINNGKNTKFNSGNYFGLRIKYITPFSGNSDKARNSLLTNVHWGIQRAIGGNWLLNFHLGVGYATDLDYGGTAYPSIDIKFAYVL